MSATDELEPQQYGKHYWEEDIPLADVRVKLMRQLLYGGVVVFAILMLLGAFVKFPDQVELPFVLKNEAPDESYNFPYPVYVSERYVVAGNEVKENQPLMKISSPEIVVLLNNYEEAKKSLENFRLRKNMSVNNQRVIITTHIRETQNKQAAVKAELASLENTWASNKERLEFEYSRAEKKLASDKELYKGKYVSENELKETEEKYIKAGDARKTAKLTYEKESTNLSAISSQYSLSILSLNQELDKLSSDTKFDSSALLNQLETTKNRISNTFGNFDIAEGNLVLKATKAGLVTYVFEGDKEVQSSAILLKINHKSSGLYSSVSCPPTMIGKVRKNQTAYLKLATFPAYEWGSVKGHVANFSMANDEKGDFTVRIDMDDYRKLNNMLQPGLTGNVTIVLHERTFFQYFFRALKKSYYTVTMNN